MQEFDVNELKEHPRNQEFFDDISGDEWKDFLQSIKTSGVIEPIVITQNKVIVSGHQRVRACKELGIPTIMAEMRDYKDEDEILKALLETNLRQRGTVGGSVKQIGRRIMELERLYGIQHGGDRRSKVEKSPLKESSQPKTQEELASMLGISLDTLKNYKTLTQMIPELEELVDTGIVSKSAALAVLKELDTNEQEQLISALDVTHRITGKEIQEAIKDMKADYDDLEEQIKEKNEQITEKKQTIKDLQDQIASMNATQDERKKMIVDASLVFCSRADSFLRDVGGYVWLTDSIKELPEADQEVYRRAIDRLGEWIAELNYKLNNTQEVIVA